MTGENVVPVLLLALLPPLLLFMADRIGVIHLFASRYLLCKEVGAALLGAWAVQGIAHATARKSAVIAVAVLSVVLSPPHMGAHGREDWRASSEWVRAEVARHPEMPIVLVSGFVESLEPGRLDDPAYREILFAPQTVYPVPGEAFRLPWKQNGEAERKLKGEVVPYALSAGRIAVVSRPLEDSYEALLVGSLRASGVDLVEKRKFGTVLGLLFESRTASPTSLRREPGA